MTVYTENPRQRQFLEQLRANERKRARLDRWFSEKFRREVSNEHGINDPRLEPARL